MTAAMFGFSAFVAVSSEPAEAQKANISAAAQECGTEVRFIDLPPEFTKQLPQLGTFAFELGQDATPAQVRCVADKVPMTRVGFIREPVPQQKKN